MRFFINFDGFASWRGGRDFVLSLCDTLRLCRDLADIEFVLLVPNLSLKQKVKRQIRLALARLKLLPPRYFYDVDYDSINAELVSELNQIGLTNVVGIDIRDPLTSLNFREDDVLLPCFHDLEYPCFNSIYYIADFQHEYFPDFFSGRALTERRRKYSQIASLASFLIVNSSKTKADLFKYTNFRGTCFVMPPSSQKINVEPDLSSVARFGLVEKKFLICCNQFWEHKDHLTLLKAFELIKIVRPELKLVFTGELRSSGSSPYIAQLLYEIEHSRFRNDIIVTGYIPKKDQLGLLASSLVSVQPTLFEGGRGGGFSFETVSLGKPLILSDIEINTEIEHFPGVFFFKAGNPKSLANVFLDLYDSNTLLSFNSDLNELFHEWETDFAVFWASVIRTVMQRKYEETE